MKLCGNTVLIAGGATGLAQLAVVALNHIGRIYELSNFRRVEGSQAARETCLIPAQ